MPIFSEEEEEPADIDTCATGDAMSMGELPVEGGEDFATEWCI